MFAVHGLARALVTRGHEVSVLTTDLDGPGRLAVPLGVPVDLDGVRVEYHAVGRLRRLHHAPTLALALRQLVPGQHVVHLHSVFLWPTLAAARAAERSGIPWLVSPRGMLVPELLALRGSVRKRLWIRLFERRTVERAAGIVVTSHREALDVSRMGLRLPRIFEVPNGVDPGPYEAKPAAPPSDPIREALDGPPFLLFLGRLSWKKGLDRLIAGLPTIPAPLVVAGGDDEGIRPRLEDLAARLGVRERVRFVGQVGMSDKVHLLQTALALVLPSHSENFANVVLEAMAAACPVVVTAEVGLSEVVSSTATGVVCDGDPESLAATLGQLLAARPALAAMGARGPAVVRQRFAWTTVAARMESVYASVIEAAS
jgi:glycosyltransferase involved in cell wall biosynthesis